MGVHKIQDNEGIREKEKGQACRNEFREGSDMQ